MTGQRKESFMHHGILGAGGVGGLIGAVLAKAGEDVTLIVRPEALAQHPNTLSLESAFGKFTVPVSLAAQSGLPLDVHFDVLWITVKATQLQSALASISAVTRIGAVVPLLNGIDHVQLLRERFGHDRVIPATIAVESERTAPGVIVHRSPWARLNAAASGRQLLEKAFDEFRRFGFECNFVDDETTLLWSKLSFLAPLALSTTAAAGPIGAVLSDPTRKALFEACVREACAVAHACGAALDANVVLGNIGKLPSQMRSSMQKDVAAGHPPELDAIAGPIERGAEKQGLQVPATHALVAEIRKRLAG
jgi:2-dehydropantoate 2-reductase